jgi:hypothetical protein
MDGSHDFDFIHGRWRVQNRRLDDPLDEEASVWSEFEATSEARPILGGLGNVDTFHAPTFPGRPEYHGLALRLFDADAGLWRIWWASTVGQGRLDAPLVGRFRDGLGTFECDDMIDGREVRLRFFWKDITDSSATWEQAFSFDGGRSFKTNWVMRFERTS